MYIYIYIYIYICDEEMYDNSKTSMPKQKYNKTDVHTPFLGTPLVPLKRSWAISIRIHKYTYT